MVSAITQDIKVSVEAHFKESFSNPKLSKFLFSYDVFIENFNSFPVKLLSRHWNIFDSFGGSRVVEGMGVIGKQPIIEPNGSYHYTSWCPLESEIGYMDGNYYFLNVETQESFEVLIPRFELISPLIQN